MADSREVLEILIDEIQIAENEGLGQIESRDVVFAEHSEFAVFVDGQWFIVTARPAREAEHRKYLNRLHEEAIKDDASRVKSVERAQSVLHTAEVRTERRKGQGLFKKGE